MALHTTSKCAMKWEPSTFTVFPQGLWSISALPPSVLEWHSVAPPCCRLSLASVVCPQGTMDKNLYGAPGANCDVKVQGINDHKGHEIGLMLTHARHLPGCICPGTNCSTPLRSQAEDQKPNVGCGIKDFTYGEGFNQGGGGVYAMEWTSDGISVWFFPRRHIPRDLHCKK